MRRLWHRVEETSRLKIQSTLGAHVTARDAPLANCPVCGKSSWKVQKTVARSGKTIAHGQFAARETIFECGSGCYHHCGARVIHRSLAKHLLPARGVGYDLMVFVGIERFVHHRQREEIRAALERKHGLTVSSGEVSELAKVFLEYLARLHHECTDRLRGALQNDGGWPLHVDATGEHGRATLLVVMAGWRQWVLGAWKISTEHSELILPCLRETVRSFGTPCAAMRDLGRAVTPAINDLVQELEKEIPVLACHQHFLADIAKDLLETSHAELRALFRRTKVRPKLRSLVRDLGRKIGQAITQARQAVLKWQSLADNAHHLPPGCDGLAIVRAVAQWTLDYPADATGLDFPFDRPYLDLYDRCLVALRATDAFLRTPPQDRQVRRALERLQRSLAPVVCEVPFQPITGRLRRRAALFDELRHTLRLAAAPPQNETEQELHEIHTQLDELTESLAQRRPERGAAHDSREAIDLIVEHIQRHGDNLWGHAITLPQSAGGGVRLVARTNCLLENLFKDIKHGERRRSGRKNLTQDLEHLPAEAALVSNLERADYVSIVCGSLHRLPAVFAQLDQEERERKLRGIPPAEHEDLKSVLHIATASLSSVDKRVVRNDAMKQRMTAAARSRAPKRRI